MTRIDQCFQRAKEEKRARFVAYVCAGDPDYETSLEVCRTLIKGGVDLLELGVPFSDPLADGLTNQLAAERALNSGMTQEHVFQLVRDIRQFSEVPIVFYSYYNLIYSQGLRNYVQKAKDAGVDGMLTLDLPPEEAAELDEAARELGIQTVFILAPTSPESRIKLISDYTTGFLYYVSHEGVTGVRKDLASDLDNKVNSIRQITEKPLVVGFGISTPQHVRQVAKIADGVVVGSALVNCIRDNLDNRENIIPQLTDRLAQLRGALDPR